MPTELITEFLRHLNDVWQRREQRHVQRVRTKYLKQVRELRRQVNHRLPYDNVMARRTERRLRSNLRAARSHRGVRSVLR